MCNYPVCTLFFLATWFTTAQSRLEQLPHRMRCHMTKECGVCSALYSSFIPYLLALYLTLLKISVAHAMATFALIAKCKTGEEQVIVPILRRKSS